MLLALPSAAYMRRWNDLDGGCRSMLRVITRPVLLEGCEAVIAQNGQPALIDKVADRTDTRCARAVQGAQLDVQRVTGRERGRPGVGGEIQRRDAGDRYGWASVRRSNNLMGQCGQK